MPEILSSLLGMRTPYCIPRLHFSPNERA